MKKKNSKLSGFYLGLIFVLMYLPIAVVIVFSFNEFGEKSNTGGRYGEIKKTNP